MKKTFAFIWPAICLVILLAIEMTDAENAAPPSWWPQAQENAPTNGFRLISSESLNALYKAKEPFLLLDVRPDYEYKQGYLTGAMNMEFDLGDRLSLSSERRQALKKVLGSDHNRRIIIYCRSFR